MKFANPRPGIPLSLRRAITDSFRRSRPFTGVRLIHIPYVIDGTACVVVVDPYRTNGTIAINRFVELEECVGSGLVFQERLLSWVAWNTGPGVDQTPRRTVGRCTRYRCNLPVDATSSTCWNEVCLYREHLNQLCDRWGLRFIALGTTGDGKFFMDSVQHRAILLCHRASGHAVMLPHGTARGAEAWPRILKEPFSTTTSSAITSALLWTKRPIAEIAVDSAH